MSAFLSIGPRAAAFAFATRFLIAIFAQPSEVSGQWAVLGELPWTDILAVVSGLTLWIGSLLAFRQTRAKRLVSCLVVAESGFLLLGLLVLDEIGVAALLYNWVVQFFALIGIYSVFAFFLGELRSDQLTDLQGFFRKAVPEGICLLIFLLCLVGSPPMPGFMGKFTLIGAAIRHQHFLLACTAIFSMVLSTASIARLSYHLIGNFRDRSQDPITSRPWRRAFLMGWMVPMAFVGLFADFVLGWARQSLGFIFW